MESANTSSRTQHNRTRCRPTGGAGPPGSRDNRPGAGSPPPPDGRSRDNVPCHGVGGGFQPAASEGTAAVVQPGMGPGGAVAIGRALASNPPLLTICLSNNTIRDEGAIAIANGLKSNSTLTWLGLAFNDIGDEGATALATALKSLNSTITVLILMGNRIGEGGAVAMATQLSTSSLKRLDLDENCIGEDGFAAMGSLMNSNRTLRVWGLAVQRR